MLLQTLDAEEGIVLQTVPIVHPVSVQATVRSKRKAVSGHPYTHIQCNVDTVRAFMSITKYQTAANILLAAITSLLNPPHEKADDDTSLESISSATVNHDVSAVSRPTGVERFFEISMQHLDITIVSDYIEELELFFIYMKVNILPSSKMVMFWP